MLHETIDLHYQLTFTTPFHFGTGLRLGLIDRAITRAADGSLYVPGSTLKGMLRDHATQIARLLGLNVREPHNLEHGAGEFARVGDVVALIFGSRYRAGTLFFDDARLTENDYDFFNPRAAGAIVVAQTEARTQVSISRVTGTARRGLLFSSEYGVAGMTFVGRIYGRLSGIPLVDEPAMSYSLVLLLAALLNLERVGGNKSSGAGHLTCDIRSLSVEGQSRTVREYLDHLYEFEMYELAEGDD